MMYTATFSRVESSELIGLHYTIGLSFFCNFVNLRVVLLSNNTERFILQGKVAERLGEAVYVR